MAKKGTLDHPKLISLADALDIDQCFALGILEAIWHFTSQYAKDGEIGRFSDRAIATGIRTTIKAEKLIKALVQTKWLDEDEECRLRVHDWQDHAYNWVKSENGKAPRGRPFTAGEDDRRNCNGRPPKLQTETANDEEVSANETANGTAKRDSVSSKLTASRASHPIPSLPRDKTSHNPSFEKQTSRQRGENPRAMGTNPRAQGTSPRQLRALRSGGEYAADDFVTPWDMGLPEQVARAKLLRIDTENCDCEIEDLDTGMHWVCYGPTWKQAPIPVKVVQGGG